MKYFVDDAGTLTENYSELVLADQRMEFSPRGQIPTKEKLCAI